MPGNEADGWHHHRDPHFRMRGVSVDRHREFQTPQWYDDAYYRDQEFQFQEDDPMMMGMGGGMTEPLLFDDQARRVTVKHILTSGEPSRARSSMAGYHNLPPLPHHLQHGGGLPEPGRLERHLSHPNLRPRPGGPAGGRQLPKTPVHPPGTIIVIENVLPEQPHPLASAAAMDNKKTPVRYHDQLRRANSLPRRRRSRTGCRLPATPKTPSGTLPKTPLPKTPGGTGRRLPPTPHQSSLALHHNAAAAPFIPPVTAAVAAVVASAAAPTMMNKPSSRKRELPKPQSLDLRHSNRELIRSGQRISSRSMNFPRVERSPSRMSDFNGFNGNGVGGNGDSSLELELMCGGGGEMDSDTGMMPALPPNMMRNHLYRRPMFE